MNLAVLVRAKLAEDAENGARIERQREAVGRLADLADLGLYELAKIHGAPVLNARDLMTSGYPIAVLMLKRAFDHDGPAPNELNVR